MNITLLCAYTVRAHAYLHVLCFILGHSATHWGVLKSVCRMPLTV